jgi:hypothetical protein
VLCKALGRKPYAAKVDAPMYVTWNEGKDKQARLNNDWMRDIMVGDWECLSCGHIHEFRRAPKKCHTCASQRIKYKEVVFYHQGSHAQGSVDAIVNVGRPLLLLVEFKIMAPDAWESLKAPLAEHRARSKLYMEIILGSSHPMRGHIDTERMHVLYCSRAFGKKDPIKGRISPFKEFVVERDVKEADTYMGMARAVTECKVHDWEIYPTGICSAITDKRVHGCPVAKECFSGAFKPTVFWK